MACLEEVLALAAAHLQGEPAHQPTGNSRIAALATAHNRKMFCLCLLLLFEPHVARMVGRMCTVDRLPQEASQLANLHSVQWTGKRPLAGMDCSGKFALEEAKRQKIAVAQTELEERRVALQTHHSNCL